MIHRYLTLLTVTLFVFAVTILAPALGSLAAPPGDRTATPAQPSSLAAVHHSGQTFLTWHERSDLPAALYRVYRHTQPITAANLAQATLLYTVPTASARFFANRYNVEGSGVWAERYSTRFVIPGGSAPLAAGTGLLVWTLAPVDFDGATAGVAYYAVTTQQGTSENRADFDAGNTTGPLPEAIGNPLPVEITVPGLSAEGHIYLQYMPLRDWNATFHAPNAQNGYYGLDAADPAVANAIQYAYDYAIYAPTATECGGTLPDKVPVVVNLHGWNDNAYAPALSNPDPWDWCVYRIYPVDQSQTWWFGFARTFDYHSGGIPGPGDTVVNFTEQRVLRMVYDLERDPPGPPVDPNRVYIYGQSMGGSGALAFALRYPNVFAAAYASEPMTNYATAGDAGGTDWRADVEVKWGTLADNLSVQLGAPGGWAANLQRYNGTGVWDWQNHQANIQSRHRDETVPVGIAHGTADTTIEWATQGQPVYAAFNSGNRAWGGAVVNADHTWLGFAGPPYDLAPDPSTMAPFLGFQVVRAESVPGLSNSSSDLAIPPTMPGGYNQTLRWSSSWDNWDGPPIDTATRWQISLCTHDEDIYVNACGSGPTLTVDVTPRRLQHFAVVAGARYIWENRRVADNSLVVSSTVAAGLDGVLTVPAVALSAPAGHRLILQPAGTLVTATPSITPPSPGSATPTTTRVPTASSTPTPSPSSTPTLTPDAAGTRVAYFPLIQTAADIPTATSPPPPTMTATYPPTDTPTATNTPTATAIGTPTAAARTWPDTTSGIHVFNDQLASSLSEAQWSFAATHYAGTQKMTRSDADHLRALNPAFLILHYRLGDGLGYRAVQNGCLPTGDYVRIVEGNEWVQEWPGTAVQERWFAHWPDASATRVLNCDWGWFLMNLDDAAYRTYWQAEVMRQLQANDDDGLFLDSLSVPNYLGADHYAPPVPDVDSTYEADWATRIGHWLTWLQEQPTGAYAIIPNAGAWITSRDPTDYSGADGIMLEGFALWADESPHARDDWKLQMNRALGLIAQDKIVIGQTYVTGVHERLFALGTYLLIKGSRTYVNLDFDLDPEWWPEYDIPIGVPQTSAGTDIDTLAVGTLYRRNFSNGFVLVNPDDNGSPVTLPLGGTFYLAQPSGGGAVPSTGIPTGTLTYQATDQVTLPPYSAAILLNQAP